MNWERWWSFLVPVKGGALGSLLQVCSPASHPAHMAQGTERGHGTWHCRGCSRLGSRARDHTQREVSKGHWWSLSVCSQAAELVSKNWEAYEAHMRDVRDYLEATLEVSTFGPFPQSQAAGCGAWSRVGISLWPCHPLIRTELFGNLERFIAL